jgi:transcriptional regulator with XRE-family HTH domain
MICITRQLEPLDRHVARRILMRRWELGLTQQRVAALIGVGYQMVRKYERGMNRISAGHLHAIAVALRTDVAFFFDDAEVVPTGAEPSDIQHRLHDLMADVDRIANPRHRRAVYTVAKAMADRAGVDDDES